MVLFVGCSAQHLLVFDVELLQVLIQFLGMNCVKCITDQGLLYKNQFYGLGSIEIVVIITK